MDAQNREQFFENFNNGLHIFFNVGYTTPRINISSNTGAKNKVRMIYNSSFSVTVAL